MMNFSLPLLTAIFAGAVLVSALFSLTSIRLPLVLRGYTFSSFFLALLAGTIGFQFDSEHLLTIGIAILLVKTIAIPLLLFHTAERSGASMRLACYIRPTPTYYIAGLVLLILLFTLQTSPFSAFVNPGYLLYLSVGLVLIGFLMMLLRKNIYSQIIGFLTMENGISVFSITVAREVPFLIETGILSAVLIGAILMSILSRRVRELYGSEDTSSLHELID